MAVNEWLADNLIDSVRAQALIPASDEESTTAAIRSQLNFEQRLYLSALIQRAREDYLTESADFAILPNVSRYALPPRATAAAIRRISKMTSGQETPVYPVRQERLAAMGGTAFGTGDYYFDGNFLVLLCTPSQSDVWRVFYARRLNKVVDPSTACVVTALNTGANTVTLALASDGVTTTLPDTFTTSAAYDFTQGTPHFDVLDSNRAVSLVAANVLTFTAALPTGLAVGDMLALAGQTPICNVPAELQDVLVLKAAHSYVAARGDANKVQLLADRWKQAESDALTLIAPRTKDSPDLLINPNAPGWNRMRWRWRRAQ